MGSNWERIRIFFSDFLGTFIGIEIACNTDLEVIESPFVTEIGGLTTSKVNHLQLIEGDRIISLIKRNTIVHSPDIDSTLS